MNARERRSILRAAYNASKAGQAELYVKARPYRNLPWSNTLYMVNFRHAMTCSGCKMPRLSGRSYETHFVPYGKGRRGIPTWGPFRPRRWQCTHCKTWNQTPIARLSGKPTRRNDSYMKRQSRPR